MSDKKKKTAEEVPAAVVPVPAAPKPSKVKVPKLPKKDKTRLPRKQKKALKAKAKV